MGYNQRVAEISLEELNKFRSDSNLFDAIVQGDMALVLYLVNNRYKLDVVNGNYTREPISIAKIIEAVELGLSKNKHIRLLNWRLKGECKIWTIK